MRVVDDRCHLLNPSPASSLLAEIALISDFLALNAYLLALGSSATIISVRAMRQFRKSSEVLVRISSAVTGELDNDFRARHPIPAEKLKSPRGETPGAPRRRTPWGPWVGTATVRSKRGFLSGPSRSAVARAPARVPGHARRYARTLHHIFI